MGSFIRNIISVVNPSRQIGDCALTLYAITNEYTQNFIGFHIVSHSNFPTIEFLMRNFERREKPVFSGSFF